jgi:hypothetical protein
MLPLACTVYANAHFHYAKSLQFQDQRDFGAQMSLMKVSGLNTFFSYLNNFFSAGKIQNIIRKNISRPFLSSGIVIPGFV